MNLTFLVIFLSITVVVGAATFFAHHVLFGVPRREMLRQIEGNARRPAADYPGANLLLDPVVPSTGPLAWLPNLIRALDLRAASAGLEWTGAFILTASVGLAIAGALIGWVFPFLIFRWLSAAVLAFSLAFSPFAILNYRRATRLREFEEQFPEALDFIARALRAGHAFSVSLEMLASESPEPLCFEFRRIFQELNLGAPIEPTLLSFAQRVPLVDVKFFVSAVLLQREAGGNLSEILTNLAHTVRERFRLKGHVRAATAHARISATVLTILPIVVLIGLQIRSPKYVGVFVADPMGPFLLLGALLGQAVGYLLMRKLINFRI
jgi:tight adherence protein B